MKKLENYPDYYIDTSGDVWSNKSGELKKLKPYISSKGYYLVDIGTKNSRVHRLVAEAFILNPENKKEVNHINGIKTDNRVENLEWCTRSDNMKHAVMMGFHVRPNTQGSANGQAKLTESQVILIREDTRTHKIISLEYNVSQSLISNIKQRIRWNHI